MCRFVMHRDTSLGVGEPCRSIDRIFFFGNNPVLVHGAILEIEINQPSVFYEKANVNLPRFLTMGGEVNVDVR